MTMAATMAASRFESRGGRETFVVIDAPPGASFAEQLRAVERAYGEAILRYDLKPGGAVFRRLFVSDLINQQAMLADSPLARPPAEDPVAVSLVQQPPSAGSKVAMLAYHIDGAPLNKHQLETGQMVVEKNGLRHLWSTGLCAGATTGPADAGRQTREVFDRLTEAILGQGGSLRDHCVRTWIYLKDVDVFYRPMVDSRIAVFDRHGLTADTHYLASTGIEGACRHQFDVVAMDAYSLLGMAPGQMSFLNDFDCLCPTRDYGVTFERGTRIAFADRAHHYISGTASIDRHGWVLHPGDTLAQLERALFNVDALRRSGGAGLEDLRYLLAYVRDPTDGPAVRRHLRRRFPELPVLVVQGAVCRPEWLVEVEGVAVAANDQPRLPEF